MQYDFIDIPDADVPQAVEPTFQHVLQTYASEANKTVSVWRAVPDDLLDFKPHEKTNPIRTILVHQLLSERRFFAQFVGTEEPPVEDLLPPGEKPVVQAYIDKFIWLAKRRLSQLAGGTTSWWWRAGPSSAACSGSGFGSSGDVFCTPATTGRKCRPGCASPASTSRRSTGLPAT
jgi:hypothetical protein